MMSCRRLLSVLLACLPLTAVMATDYSKMSALVRRIVAQQHREPASAVTRGAAVGDLPIITFLEADPSDVPQIMERVGGHLLAALGDVAVVQVTVSQLPLLSDLPQVRRIETRRASARILMDTVPRIIGAQDVYSPSALHDAFSGRGVMVGVMDVGFDLTHPTFYTDSLLSDYRIRYFWDQLSADTVGSRMPVGRDFTTSAELLAVGCSRNSTIQTHGTHTLGIVAGSGFNSPYRGIAFGSDIALVSNAVTQDTVFISPSDYYRYTTATDALGFHYLFSCAERSGQPCVVSFSEGYTCTDSDDDRLFATFLERLTGPGRIIVAAAGNENELPSYVEKPVGTVVAGAFIHPFGREAAYRATVAGKALLHLMAYDRANGQQTAALTLRSDDGRMDSLLTDTLVAGTDTCVVSVSRHRAAMLGGYMLILQLSANKPFSKLSHMALVAEGTDSRVQLMGSRSCSFRNGSYDGSQPVDERWSSAERSHSLLAPGTFPGVICVGATGYRSSYVNFRGEQLGVDTTTVAGSVTPWSSVGPTIDGRRKPDVVAPGQNVVSAFNSFYDEAITDDGYRNPVISFFEHDGRRYGWNSNTGTSMACPVVAGVVALWLEANPLLTPADVLGVMSRTCRRSDSALDYPNSLYGHGEIDAYRGLLDVLGVSGISEVSLSPAAGTTAALTNGQLLLRFARCPQSPVTVRVYAVGGSLVHQSVHRPSQCNLQIALQSLAGGVYVVQVSCADRGLSGSLIVRRSPAAQ